MKQLLLTLVLLALCGAAPGGGSEDRKHACAAVKEKIRRVESRMRAGYTRAQGERYEEKLRELRDQRYRLCR